jgi:hypothetical protein
VAGCFGYLDGQLKVLELVREPNQIKEIWRSNETDRCTASFAAWLHSWIGIVKAGSFFACLQSAGMDGWGVAVISGIMRFFAFVSSCFWYLFSQGGSDAGGVALAMNDTLAG